MNPSNKIIGHGTWYDKVAIEIAKRERNLGRSMDLLRVESGVAASGIPHIGSLSEVTRNYAVSLALREQGYNSEFIVFSDNKDGLRTVPKGLPKSLEKFLGLPVTKVPDPFGGHGSFGDHVISLLLEALDKSGVNYTFMSGVEAYEKGLLNEEIRILLENAERVGEIVKEETGQEKYLEVLPYFPVCSSCGRIYTTRAYKFLPGESKVLYVCEGTEIMRKWMEGCGHEGEADFTKGNGKLSWKAGEFAARWRALGIRFEAYGKDIADSVRVNDRISREILGYAPPMHVQYEMYLDKGGKKISKSVGNVFTPQVWFRYGSPQSMVLLTLKRFVGTRNISVVDIPRYMDELDELEDVYFGRKRVGDTKEKAKLTGLFEYCWFMKPPEAPSIHVPYNLLTGLAKVAPGRSEVNFITGKLAEYGYLKEASSPDLEKRIEYALNWVRDFEETAGTPVELSSEERNAIRSLIEVLQAADDAETVQSAVFEIARKNGIKPTRFFKTLYLILLGTPSGPRLGPYFIDMGRRNAIKTLEKSLKEPKKTSLYSTRTARLLGSR
ncbi:MAG: lysine--tRNA ligase [Candidatus Bathyarchaeota archaeon]|nr:lysine--tRNA ligase [Candidatus Bathyarchaeota archaeon]